VSPRQGYAKIKEEIAQVLEIDDKLARAQSVIAEMNFYFDWEWGKAEEAFQKAISLVPSDANTHKLHAWFLVAMGRVQEAQSAIQRGLELEPLAPGMYLTASNVFAMAGLHEQAIARSKEALELSPNHSLALSQIGWSYLQMGLFDEAISIMERSVNSPPALLQNLWMLGHAYAVAGKSTEARGVLKELHDRAEQQYVPPVGFALVHAGLGENDEAIDWLEKAYEDRNGWMAYLNVNPLLDSLRGEPRFQDLLERMNFPD
jgi:serine/threonine-protein kinase